MSEEEKTDRIERMAAAAVTLLEAQATERLLREMFDGMSVADRKAFFDAFAEKMLVAASERVKVAANSGSDRTSYGSPGEHALNAALHAAQATVAAEFRETIAKRTGELLKDQVGSVADAYMKQALNNIRYIR